MPSFSSLFPKQAIQILDGGLGTTFEDEYGIDISHPLWSSKVIEESPSTVIDAHLAFLKAGAQIIMTSTYQCAFDRFAQVGYDTTEATRIMRRSVELAAEARRLFVKCTEEENTGASLSPKDIKIALSLGSYGAMCDPAQESYGFYPPPFGPQAFSLTNENRNAFSEAEIVEGKETTAISALTTFYLERLRVFISDDETWNSIDIIAFETVPVIREIVAIRQAMTVIHHEMEGPKEALKPWWIAVAFPVGMFPETGVEGEALAPEIVAQAFLQPATVEVNERVLEVLSPDGLGVNCCLPEFMAGIIAKIESAVPQDWSRVTSPWLVLYPNGGKVYNPATQTWSGEPEGGGSWALQMGKVVQGVLERKGPWEGIIVGGCCKTGPNDIAALRKVLH